MTGFANDAAKKFYAETYDTVMEDWPGDFNQEELSEECSEMIWIVRKKD
jgi:hypothetical protein